MTDIKLGLNGTEILSHRRFCPSTNHLNELVRRQLREAYYLRRAETQSKLEYVKCTLMTTLIMPCLSDLTNGFM